MSRSQRFRMMLAWAALAAGCSLSVRGERGVDQMGSSVHTPDDAGAADAELPSDAGHALDATPVETDATLHIVPDAGMPDARDVVIGTYAVKRSFATIETIHSSIFSNDVHQLTTMYSLLELSRSGAEFSLRELACRIVTESSGSFFANITVSIDDHVAQSTPEVQAVVTVSEEGGVLTLEKPMSSVPVGFLAQSSQDPIPTTAGDARVHDTDNDGNPGATVHIVADLPLNTVDGDAYYVQWNRNRFLVTRDAQGGLSGPNFDANELRIIGTSPGDDVLASPQEVHDDPDTSRNLAQLIKLDDDPDCAQLLSRLEALFPAAP